MTRHLVPSLRTTVEALQRAGAATETAIGVVTDARSAVDAADADLDEQLAAFESALLRSVGKNRQDRAVKDDEEEAGTTPTAVPPPVPASPRTPVSTGPAPTPPVLPS